MCCMPRGQHAINYIYIIAYMYVQVSFDVIHFDIQFRYLHPHTDIHIFSAVVKLYIPVFVLKQNIL